MDDMQKTLTAMKINCKHILLSVGLMAAAGTMTAQELNSAYFTQDFKFRHDLNPAFGNDQGYVTILPGLSQLNVKTQGNFGVRDVLFKNPATGKYDRTFLHPDVPTDEALKGFADGKNRLAADVRIALLSAGFKGFGGYNTIELNMRGSAGLYLPGNLIRFAKNMTNDVYHFDFGARAMAFGEIALGHSRQIDDNLRMGAKLKALLGVARADLQVKNMEARFTGNEWLLTSGEAQAEVNMKGIKFVDDMEDTYKNGTRNEHVDLDETDIDGAGVSGFGLGLDLGAEYRVEGVEGLRLSAALTDLGFINWNNSNVLKQKKGTFVFDGFHDVAVNDDDAAPGTTMEEQSDSYADQFSDFINMKNEGDKGSKTTMLAATMNIGAEYQLPMYKRLSFGLLGQHHFAGEYSWTEGRLSANWMPLKWLDGGVSLAVNTFCVSAGWVLNIHPKGFNIFVGMDHIQGKQTKDGVPLSSNSSLVIGMNIAWGGGK